MVAVLRDNQHELLLPNQSVSLVFGSEETGYQATAYPTLEAGEGTQGDVQRVREDGVAFGEDYLGGKSYTFEIAVLADRHAPMGERHSQVLERLDTIEGVWRNPEFRERSNDIGILRSRYAGRVTRCYGRPRRYDETAGRLAHKGMVPVVADFRIADGRFYDDAEQIVDASLVRPESGGLRTPITFPWSAVNTSAGLTSITVGGTATTWPQIEFHAVSSAITNPSVKIGDLTVGLHTSIPAGRSVRVDPRPWGRLVRRDDGANQAGKLTHATPPLRRMLLTPGTHSVLYQATDPSGTSYCRVRWRNARNRP